VEPFSVWRYYAAAFVVLGCSCVCVAADYTVEELAAGYSETVSSIETLYVEYEQRFESSDGRTQLESCIYARDGIKWHYSTVPINNSEDVVEDEKTVTCSDGKQAFLYYLPADPAANGSINLGTLEVRDARPEPMISPEYAIGVKLAELATSYPSQGSLIKLLNAQPPLPIQQVAGARQGEFVISPIEIASSSTGVEYSVRAGLDADHGFLPSLLVVEFAEKSKRKFPSHRLWSLRWETQSFQQCLDHAGETQRWFPRECKLTQTSGLDPDSGKAFHSSYSLDVQTIEINKVLDPTLFNPRIPSGTTVVDATATGKGRVSIQGGAQAVDLRARQLAANTANSGGGRYRAVIIALNLVMLVAVVMYTFFVRKVRSE